MHIALLEDDPTQAEMVEGWLVAAAHTCRHYPSARRFLKEAGRESFDLLILDWELPDSSGIEVLDWVRSRSDWLIPVLFVTNRNNQQDIVLALERGADDYMTKPASREIMLARIKALARRGQAVKALDTLDYGRFSIVQSEMQVMLNGRPIDLTDKEYQLTLMLFTNAGRLLSRDHILARVWGVGPGLATRTVDTHVSRLRRKLRLVPENGWRLKAVYQHGYRLEAIG